MILTTTTTTTIADSMRNKCTHTVNSFIHFGVFVFSVCKCNKIIIIIIVEQREERKEKSITDAIDLIYDCAK